MEEEEEVAEDGGEGIRGGVLIGPLKKPISKVPSITCSISSFSLFEHKLISKFGNNFFAGISTYSKKGCSVPEISPTSSLLFSFVSAFKATGWSA